MPSETLAAAGVLVTGMDAARMPGLDTGEDWEYVVNMDAVVNVKLAMEKMGYGRG